MRDPRNLEIGLNLVVGSSAVSRAGWTGNGAPLGTAGQIACPSLLAAGAAEVEGMRSPPQKTEGAGDRAKKREVVKALHHAIAKTGVIVVAHYGGLTVADMTRFRRDMQSAGGRVKVAKNRLVKLALEGTDAKGIADLLKGPTCVAFSDDPVAAPKVAVKFAKANDK